jgi:outer membrane lipoprotein-sorting protein
MTSGTSAAARVAALLIAAAAASASADPGRLDAPALMKMLASVESASATFVQTRYSPLLKAPLVSQGTLSYRRPDLLEQHVQSPRDERFVLKGERLSVETGSGGKSMTLPAGEGSGVAGLIEGLRAVRSGDLPALERSFALQVTGTRDRWRLSLVPRTADLSGYVLEIAIAGSGARIERIEAHEASGDRTVMDIRETVR